MYMGIRLPTNGARDAARVQHSAGGVLEEVLGVPVDGLQGRPAMGRDAGTPLP